MIFKQYYLPTLSHASYLIGDEKSGVAIVVDPQRDIEQYLQKANKHTLTIRYVFLTHFHADFVAGHLELQKQTDAQICLGIKAQADYPFQPFANGDEIECGALRVKVLETPGHTPESISLLIFDLQQSHDRPYAILTGDTLLNGDVGRTDFLTFHETSQQNLGSTLYDSLHQQILPLPDETLVYPAHGPGTYCAKNVHNVHADLSSSLGTQKHINHAIQPIPKEAFIAMMTTRQPEPPPYFPYDAALNTRNRPHLDSVFTSALNPLPLNQVLRWKTCKAQMLDVRDPEDFAKGHLVDCLNIGLNGKFETWAGTMLQPESPIVLIANPGHERQAVLRLARIGFDHVVGYLKNGILALEALPKLIRTVHQMTVEDLDTHLLSGNLPFIVDVRIREEWAERRIDRSVNIPLNHLNTRLQEIPTDRDVVVHCSNGYRSSIAASLLQLYDFRHVKDLIGGFDAWESMVMNSMGDHADVSKSLSEIRDRREGRLV